MANSGSPGADLIEELVVVVADNIPEGHEDGFGGPSVGPLQSACRYSQSDT